MAVVRGTSDSLSKKFVAQTDYDKLCLSLMSGLPNELEMALNVCTILSNEGSYMLHLEQSPRLVGLLVAQAGIWPIDDDSLRIVYMESWKGLKYKDVHRFWRSTLDMENSQLLELLGLDLGEPDPYTSIFNMESDLGALNHVGQRISTIALILHNLSFEQYNIPVLVENVDFIRFNLLCIHSSWGTLKQTAYDTMSNLASEMMLSVEKNLCSRVLFKTVMDGIQSSDRYLIIRSMDVLAQLCSHDSNEDVIPPLVDVEVYERLVSFLTVHDVYLLIYTLEAIYALSELGRYACNKIVCVNGCVGVIVNLLTLDPGTYGPSAQIGMKVVETKVPADASTTIASIGNSNAVSCTVEKPAPEPPATSETNVSSATGAAVDTDSEVFALSWLKTTYEADSRAMMSRNDVYAEYVSHSSKSGRKRVVNANVFSNYVQRVFPSTNLKKVESSTGVVTFYHGGLNRKPILAQPFSSIKTSITAASKAATSTTITTTPTQGVIQSTILKAQLSAPAKIDSAPPKKIAINGPKAPIVANVAGGQTSLIKSLLATKLLQSPQQQRQILPNSVSKMIIYSPDKSGTGAATVVRCMSPASFSQLGGTSHLQARIISSPAPGRIVAAPRGVTYTSALVTPQGKIVQAVANSAPLNGSAKIEVHPKFENPLPDKTSVPTNVIQTNCTVNHTPNNIQVKGTNPGEDQQTCDSSTGVEKKISLANNQTSASHIASQSHVIVRSSDSVSVIQSNSSTNCTSLASEQSNSVIRNNDAVLAGKTVAPPSSALPATTSSSILKSALNDFGKPVEDFATQNKDKISQKSPLLNELLDKGKGPIKEDILTKAMLENGIEICDEEYDPEIEDNGTIETSSSVQSSFSTVSSNSTAAITLPLNSGLVPQAMNIRPASVLKSLPSRYIIGSSPAVNAQTNIVIVSAPANALLLSSLQQNQLSFNPVGLPFANSGSTILNLPVTNNAGVTLNLPVSNLANSSAVTLNLPVVTSGSNTLNLPIASTSTALNIPTANTGAAAVNVPLASAAAALNVPMASAGSSLNIPIANASTALNLPLASSNAITLSIPDTDGADVSVITSVSNARAAHSATASLSTSAQSSAFHSNVAVEALLKSAAVEGNLIHTQTMATDSTSEVLVSNQSNSSVSDISSPCPIKVISRTNSASNMQVPYASNSHDLTTALEMITTTSASSFGPGRQILVVASPGKGQQGSIQVPRYAMGITDPNSLNKLNSSAVSPGETTVIRSCSTEKLPVKETIDISKIILEQLKKDTTANYLNTAQTLKRPSSDSVGMETDAAKKMRIEPKTPLLEATLKQPLSLLSSPGSVSPKLFMDSTVKDSALTSTTSLDTNSDSNESRLLSGTLLTTTTASSTLPSSSPSSSSASTSVVATMKAVPSSRLEFLCEWKNCGLKFTTTSSVFYHVSRTHASINIESSKCFWAGCDSLERKRFSLLTHLQDWHCNDKALRTRAMQRRQASQQGKIFVPHPQPTPAHPGYAPDAAMLAIKRHSVQYDNPKEFSEEQESALTKSIRLTSALILRNLVANSPLARTQVRKFEPDLAYIAMSPVESSRTIAQCLSYLSQP